jgi:hypothetical protein
MKSELDGLVEGWEEVKREADSADESSEVFELLARQSATLTLLRADDDSSTGTA